MKLSWPERKVGGEVSGMSGGMSGGELSTGDFPRPRLSTTTGMSGSRIFQWEMFGKNFPVGNCPWKNNRDNIRVTCPDPYA